MSTLKEIAEKNVQEQLKDNPCRGLVIGLSAEGVQTQLSWIMGRSPPSQNRSYLINGDAMMAKVADPSKVPSWLIPLIEYNAMNSYNDVHIVSNGSQTDDAIEGIIDCGKSFSLPVPEEVFKRLETRYCEPDPTIFTSRITGYQDLRFIKQAVLSLLRAEPEAKAHWIKIAESTAAEGIKKENFPDMSSYFDEIDKRAGLDRNKFPTIRDKFKLNVEPGLGYMLTTYMPGSKQLPPFQGEPLLVPLTGNLEQSMQYFWTALEPEWRVSVGGREMKKEGVRYATPISKFDTK